MRFHLSGLPYGAGPQSCWRWPTPAQFPKNYCTRLHRHSDQGRQMDWHMASVLNDICVGPLLPDCGEVSHRNSRGVIGFELIGRSVSERLVDSL